MRDIVTRTLEVPGAVLTYDVRAPERPGPARPLLLIGSPMAAAGFGTLAGHFPDRTVVTYDPRGIDRSTVVDPGAPVTPATRADDLHRLVEVVGGPVDVFASSGGAVDGLAWVAAHPGDVATLVAHEPPLLDVLPDKDVLVAAMKAVRERYMAEGWGAAMASFIALTSHVGPLPDDWLDRPAPDPAQFGLPTGDDGSRDDPLFGPAAAATPEFVPDLAAIAAAPTRVVLAAGAASEGQLCARAAAAVAERLGTSPVVFPGDHAGFLGGEYGQTGEPDAFAATLRAVLDGDS
ncbi:MAG: alpha/beta hydrolase [Thermoanaerobacterales bacterium]|jgi:pimeloyl-ACP methyl ester carboxylesterase|nr:alpha/beta hydrolase [Thermoanaerobacterales bacterium]